MIKLLKDQATFAFHANMRINLSLFVQDAPTNAIRGMFSKKNQLDPTFVNAHPKTQTIFVKLQKDRILNACIKNMALNMLKTWLTYAMTALLAVITQYAIIAIFIVTKGIESEDSIHPLSFVIAELLLTDAVFAKSLDQMKNALHMQTVNIMNAKHAQISNIIQYVQHAQKIATMVMNW